MATIITNYRIYTCVEVKFIDYYLKSIIEADNDEEIKAVINHDYDIEDIDCSCKEDYCNLCKCYD